MEAIIIGTEYMKRNHAGAVLRIRVVRLTRTMVWYIVPDFKNKINYTMPKGSFSMNIENGFITKIV